MEEIKEFFSRLFDTSGFPPRWHCGTWSDFHGWLYIASDLLIFSAYFTIPLFIVSYISRRRNHLSFHPLYFLFAAFILACGTTHLLDVIIFWHPFYRISAIVKLCTGIISWVTVFYIFRIAPKMFQLRTPQQMQHEIHLRESAESELKKYQVMMLESERIAKLVFSEWDLRKDQINFTDIAYDIFDIKPGIKLTFERFMNVVVPEDVAMVMEKAAAITQTGEFEPFYFRAFSPLREVRHIRATGKVVYDETGAPVMLRGSLQDVTMQRENLKKIEMQNEQLKEISWIQSHKVRGPVATILGLSEILNTEQPNDPQNSEIIESIKTVTGELDDVIKEIVAKANAITSEQY